MSNSYLVRLSAGGLLAFLLASPAQAKPIAFANGTTIMTEYGAGTMEEVQAFYAPYYWLSLGGGFLRLDSDSIHRRATSATCARTTSCIGGISTTPRPTFLRGADWDGDRQ